MHRPGRRGLAVAGVTAVAVAAVVTVTVLATHGAGAAGGSPGLAASLLPAQPSVVTGPPAPRTLPVMTVPYGVSCPMVHTCLVTGSTTGPAAASTATGGASTVARWNGTTWTALPSPGPATYQLAAIWCASADSCLAVGGTRLTASGSKQAPLAERWNGHDWTVLPVPDPVHAVQSYLSGIDCTSATACTAVGTYAYDTSGATSYALAEGWNGKAWQLEQAANPVPKETALSAVSCPSASGCEAAGTGDGEWGPLAEGWNGKAWTGQNPVPSAGGGPGGFSGVSCASASYCLAVGDTGGDDNQTLAEAWNGQRWSYLPTLAPSDYSSFSGVACWSAANCLGVGATDGVRGDVPFAARWTGHGWTVLPTRDAPRPALNSELDGLSCASATACLAVGGSDGGVGKHGYPARQRALAEWWNGARWTMLPAP